MTVIAGIDLAPVKMAMTGAKLVWGHDNAPELFGYQIAANGRFQGLVDMYVGGGSGRSVLFNGVSLKGCGATPYAAKRSFGYDDGKLILREAVKEAVYLSCIHSVFPDAINAIAVLRTGEIAPMKLDLEESYWRRLPVYRRFDHAAILVRNFPIRLAHYSPRLNTAEGALADVMRRYGASGDPYKFATRMVWQFADRAAFWWVRRVDFGEIMQDNIDIFGNPFDVATTTVKPDFRDTYSCRWKKCFWSNLASSTRQAALQIADDLLLPSTPEQTMAGMKATVQQADEAFSSRLKVHLLTLTGFTVSESERLFETNFKQASALASGIFKYLKVGTDVSRITANESRYDGDDVIVNIPHIGNNFRATFTALSKIEKPADESAAEIARQHAEAARFLGVRDAWEGNCIAINANISGLLRSVPELEYAYQSLAFGHQVEWEARVGEMMQKAINLFSQTAGRKPE